MNADLARLSPWLQYDSQESFRADSAATLTDSIGKAGPNVLKRKNGTVLAKAGDKLSLDFLGSYSGPTRGRLPRRGRARLRRRRAPAARQAAVRRPHLRPRRQGPQGRHVAPVLVFYYYNDKQFLGLGLHEGDWEMIQLRLGAGGVPDAVTFAQHEQGERCSWNGVEKRNDGAPVVYVARGSHASLLRKGRHDAPIVPDDCDAKGPLVKPALEELTLPWAKWPGLWGSTKAGSPLESSSPRGPVQHSQYTDPLHKHEQAKDCQVASRQALQMAAVPAPQPPQLKAHAKDGHAVVEWQVGADAETLVLSLDSPDDELPPATYRVEKPAPTGPRRCRRSSSSGTPTSSSGAPWTRTGSPAIRPTRR
jgi:hypothetical protein